MTKTRFLIQRETPFNLNPNTRFLVYDIDNNGYSMGIEVLDDNSNYVSVKLFHWYEEKHKETGFHFVSQEERYSHLKVHQNSKGRYFNYNKERIYLI